VFRHYRAGWGRYTQADPMEFGEQSTYRYTDGNTVRSVDPYGLYTKQDVTNKFGDAIRSSFVPYDWFAKPLSSAKEKK
jgi:hypothetical protein